MSDDKCCPPPKEVDDFIFKQASVGQICEEFPSIPVNSSLIAADGKRGLLYIGHEKKLIIIKPDVDSNPEWKLQIDLPDKVCRVALSCDCSFLAVTFSRPAAVIYDASTIHKHKLDILHEIRLSSSGGDVVVSDLKWNPAIPEMLCSVTSDHTIGCFQVSKDKKTGVQIIGMERLQGLDALCVSWSPKGKQLVVGCKNGDIVQLKPELKVARHLPGPTPSEGIVISILWVSNYQFCACYYHAGEQRVSVMIVDAPKGVTTPKFTNYEDITYGSGSTDGLIYYFEYIPEWGIIITASSHSSEVAVLGTYDNGITWNQLQLMDGSSAQLPLNRKKKTENYPVGVTVDKSPTQKLPWGTEPQNTLPNPVPILRILVTSGQLCCYHIINLKQNTPCICSPPTENVPTPQNPRQSLGPSEVSFNISSGATSTPRSRPADAHVDRPKLTMHTFGDASNSSFSFLAPGNRGVPETVPTNEIKNVGFSAPIETKTTGLFGQGDGMSNFIQQENKVNKPGFMPEPVQKITQTMPTVQQPTIQSEIKSSAVPIKPDNRTEFKVPTAPLATQTELKQTKEPPKEPPQYRQDEPKPSAKEVPIYDDAICLRAYYDEQAKFEKELKSKLDLELRTWNCGTEEERQLLVKKTEEIDEFLRELRDTTNSLASDIAYLKALLLQSFAWIEETKSKNSANVSLRSRNRGEGSKLADLQRLYYYTQSQLIQATKALDLEWAEFKNREATKMKIPNLEVIYQSLIRYNQIINQEKKNLEDLSKKWRTLARGGKDSLAILDRSMSSLNISHSNIPVSDTAIELRCKFIATNTRNFSRDKQVKLRDLLSESAPRIIRAVRPTAVQDRLEATLSSLASLKTTEVTSKPKPAKTTKEQQQKVDVAKSPAEPAKAKTHNPLSSLDNLVSGLGGTGGLGSLSKSPSSTTPFPTFGTKPSFVSPTPVQVKSKENISMGFGQNTAISQQAQATAGYNKLFDSMSFTSPTQKPADSQASKENVAAKTPTSDPTANKFSMFSVNSFGKIGGAPDNVTLGSSTAAMSNIVSVPKPTFSFSSPAASSTTPPSFASIPKTDNVPVSFKFSTSKPTSPPTAQPPSTQGTLDLSSLNFGSRQGLTITPISEVKTTAATSAPTVPSSMTFGKVSTPPQQQQQQQPQQQTSLFGQSVSTPQPVIVSMQSLFGKSATPTSTPTAVSVADKPAAVSSAPTATPTQALAPSTPSSTIASTAAATTGSPSVFGTSSMFGSLSSAANLSSSFSLKPTSTQPSATSATTAATAITTSTTTVGFGTASASTPSSTPSFGGILGATASLSFGTPSTGATVAPAFGKTPTTQTTNIFGSSAAVASTAAATTTTATTSIFGKSNGTAASATSASPFGSTSTATTTTPTSVFGSIAVPATGTSIFGGQTAAAPSGSSTEGGFFGAKAPTSTAAATAAAAPTSSIFGGTATTVSSGGSIFGGSSAATPAFGIANTTPQSNVFGSPSTTQSSTSIFGGTTAQSPSNVFGAAAPAATASVFGSATTATPAFGATTTAAQAFGATATPTTTSASIFGNAAANTGSIFGGGTAATGASPSVFGASATPTASIFGGGAAATTTTPSIFGAATATTTAASMFGAATATTTAPSGSIFGASAVTPQSPTGGIFGAAATNPGSPAGGSIFGAPANMGAGNSMFGGATSPGGSVFGQPATFGSKPVFGSPPGASGFGTGFGSPPAFGAAPATAFGSSPVLGAASPLGNNANKVFGSSTFEALGAQSGGLSFGSLAQKTTEPEKPQAFQGSSSFSSWR